MFRGNHPATVDNKGRLKLPAAFKQQLDADGVAEFYITSTDGQSAEIWPLPAWIKREEQLAESSTLDDAVQKYLNLTSYFGQQVEADAQGRVLLPQILRGKAELSGEVAVFGKMNYLEVVNQARFEANIPDFTITADDRKALAEIFRHKQA
jgi:MraZ protein